MFLFLVLALAYVSSHHNSGSIHKPRASNGGGSQLSCIKKCMKDRNTGKITIEKREMCGKKCKDKLGLPVDENDDSV